MSQLGRISGQLLKENLTRNGHDLAFETDLLYLDVTNRRIGVKNAAPTTALDVTGTTRTTNLEVTTQSDLGDITVLGDTITSNTGTLNLTNGTGDQVTYQTQLAVDDITITNNVVSTNNGDVNLELRPHGSGTVDIYADTNVYGNITVTGNIRTDGTITVGDDNTDNITINADVASNIIPDQTDTYTLGDVDHKWKDVWAQNIYADNIISGDITVDGVNLTTRQGNIYYVSVNGNDTNTGTHQNDTFKTIYHALSEAMDGDTVYVYPGRYEEIFPLDVPTGVTVHGVSLRSVVVFPTAATMYNDAFLMTGDATVEDFTLTGFRQDFVSNTGHAFAFEPGFKVTTRSPYVRNVTVITYGTPTILSVSSTQTEVVAGLTRIKNIVSDIVRNVPVSPSIGNAEIQNTLLTISDLTTAGLLEDLLDIVISIINNGADKTSLDLLTIIANSTAVSTGMLANAAAILVANTNFIKQEVYAYMVFTYPLSTIDETLTKNNMSLILDAMEYDIIRSGNEHSVYAGLGFWTYPANDPRGYASGDAGAGANLNGALADPDSREAAMLFNGVTFITPNQESITATNGARVEWTNSFTYFANKSMYLYSSPEGFAGNGKTRIKITNRTGTWAVGNTLSYYGTDGTTVLASGIIESITGDFYNIDTRVLGFETPSDRAGKTITVHGNAKLATAVKKFGTASLALDGTGDYLSIATQPDFGFPFIALRSVKTITVNGNAAVSATQSKFGGSSIAFDGTGDYLRIASNADFNFGTGAFTVECWVRLTSLTGTQIIFDFRNDGTAPSSYAPIVTLSSGTLVYQTIAGNRIVGTLLTINTWYHVAVARSGTATKLFLNGTQVGSTYTDTNTYIQGQLTIGAQYNNSFSVNGYIDEVRVSNTARYTTTFTPSTTAFTADSASKLLIHGDSTIVDEVGTSTDFTLEAWIYPTVTTYHSIFDFRSVSTEEAIYLGINLSDQVYLYVNGAVPITTAAISLNVWTHVAVVRSSGTTKIYINGTQSGSSWADITNYGTTKPLRIGAWYNALYGFNGYIDDVRITKGVARYTATFPVPTTQLTGDLSTVLLITCNGLNNSTAIADNGVTLQDLRTSAGGLATIIDFADYSDFGVEVRSIGAASVYGDYGIYGDGPGVIAYLVGENLAYIGNGKETDNDPTTVIQANEIVELNGAKIYYQSADAKGDFRIGDLFYVNQQTGEVTFPNSTITIGTSLTFDNGVGDVTYLDATKIETGDFRISGNTIETLTQDFNIQAASNLINLESNVTITGNLDVTGDVTIGGNITIGDQSTDTVSFVAGVDSDIVPNNPLGVPVYNLGTLAKQWLNLYSSQLTISDVQIDTNVVRTTATNTNLSLQANGSGRIYVPSNNVELGQNLTVNGTTYLKDTTIVGTVTHTGGVTQTGDVTQIGNVGITGTLTVSSYAQFQDIKVDTNQVTTTIGNNNLELAAHGTGKIYVPSNDVQIDQNLTVNGTIYTNALQVTQPLEANKFTTGDITIEDNIITTTIGNNNLELRAAGTGLIEFEQFQVQENELKMSTSADMVLTPNGTGIVNINSTQSIKVPVGTTGERPGTPVAGMIRFNTSLTRYEGYDGTNWVRLDGVADVDNNTYITAELTPGANDNTFRFVTNSVQVADLNSTRLSAINVDVDSINLNGNTISTNVTDTELLVQTSGTGSVKIGNLNFKNNSITNYVSDSITVINQTGNSYFKVAGTYGLVIPSGLTIERPFIQETGMIRFNTIDQRVEVFTGTDWVSAAGTSSGITVTEATDIAILSAIIFG